MKQLLRTLILLLVRIYGLAGSRKAEGNRASVPPERPRILLVRPDHLGDMILVTPILNALKERLPEAEITMLVGPWSSEVVARHPAVTRVITCSFPGFQRAPQKPLEPYKLLIQTSRLLAREHYDVALNLRSDFWWGAALLYLAKVPYRIGYAVTPNQHFLNKLLPFPEAEHATVSNLRLASAALSILNRPALPEPYRPEQYPLVFMPSTEEREQVTERLQKAGIQPETKVVVIHAGTGGAVKLWRSEAWAALADHLQSGSFFQERPRMVLTGSPSERPLLEEIASAMHTEKPLLITDTTVGQLAALLKQAQFVLGVDNGPLHIATAQGTPTLRLFGPTDEHIFGPWGDPQRQRIVRSTQPCPGCTRIPCGRLDFTKAELAEHPCVKRITIAQVEQTLRQMLSEMYDIQV